MSDKTPEEQYDEIIDEMQAKLNLRYLCQMKFFRCFNLIAFAILLVLIALFISMR